MKGQSSMETLITVGVILAFTVPVVLLLFSFTSVSHEETMIAQADATARSLAEAISYVYAQGDGARRDVILNVPASATEVEISPRSDGLPGGEVIVRLRTSSGIVDIAAPTFARVNGYYFSRSGLYSIQINNTQGVVYVSETTK